nr:putative integron gene cassette protein [uncultured bacterium]
MISSVRRRHTNSGKTMLEGNRKRVQQLTGPEIWAFIVARVLIGFAVGVFAVAYFPRIATHLAWPALILGALLFMVAAKGLLRRGA